ncbi:MAG: GAF domain-containing sensor histidine kinase [Actinobacteria bacterium]|nr:GAF domain-containing sensor histidine kinase [Actinomycetota bacterium]
MLVVAGLALYLKNRPIPGADQFFDPVLPAMAIAFPLVGAMIAARRPRQPIGWICCAPLVVAIAFFAEQYAVHSVFASTNRLPGDQWMGWLGAWVWVPGYLAIWTLLLLLFPDGRPPTPRWRPLVWATVALIATATVATAVTANGLDSPSLPNPVGLAQAPDIGGPLQATTVLVLAPLCLLGLLVRYRRTPPIERRPLKWFTAAAALVVSVPVVATVAGLLLNVPVPMGPYQVAGVVALLALAASVAIAAVKYGLYDIGLEVDAIVNRLLVYGSLLAVAAGLFVAVMGLVRALLSGQPLLAPLLVATAGAALVWRPLRRRIQHAVDRLLYRVRGYDYRLLTALGQCVRSTVGTDSVLPAMVETMAVALKLPLVGVTVGYGDDVVASATYGEPRSDALVIPLVHQDEQVGRLTVAPRSFGEPFDAADRRLLDDLAGQVALAAQAFCLTADLQRSRERLVTAREEERRRLRRDLHDGLQPALAGVSLGLDAVRNILGGDAPVDDLLARLRTELVNAGADIRRLVYDLRPPALDELGLVGALRQQASRFGLSSDGPDVVVTAPSDLKGLPAAVEVAAYRIAQEAVENVRKHAAARRCDVILALTDGHLELEIRDDGEGLDPGRTAGVGLMAMRERAAELGGTCSVESLAAGGARVRASLPTASR